MSPRRRTIYLFTSRESFLDTVNSSVPSLLSSTWKLPSVLCKLIPLIKHCGPWPTAQGYVGYTWYTSERLPRNWGLANGDELTSYLVEISSFQIVTKKRKRIPFATRCNSPFDRLFEIFIWFILNAQTFSNQNRAIKRDDKFSSQPGG